jgi:tRNA/rRNA methyltransferase
VRAELTVVLDRPKEDGNIGAVARAIKNFGGRSLVLVAPRAPLGGEAYRRAMAGRSLLQRAKIVDRLEEVLETQDLVIGSTDLSTGRTDSYLRRSVTPAELGRILRAVSGKVALLLGPEDNGLDREALERCDLLVHIPTDRRSPSMNLSHAAAVLLYEIYQRQTPPLPPSLRPPPVPLGGREERLFYEMLARFLEEIHYPKHKRPAMALLVRRVLGRALPSSYEYSMLLGFLRRAEYAWRKEWKRTGLPG